MRGAIRDGEFANVLWRVVFLCPTFLHSWTTSSDSNEPDRKRFTSTIGRVAKSESLAIFEFAIVVSVERQNSDATSKLHRVRATARTILVKVPKKGRDYRWGQPARHKMHVQESKKEAG